MELRSTGAAMTRAIGGAIAPLLTRSDVVMLSGDLGAGKTELAKGLVAAMGVTDPVVSPTFALVREYSGSIPVYHLDVYRLDRLQEAIDLGLEEMLDAGVMLIEWGEGIRELLPADRLEITLSFPPVGDPEARSHDTRALRIEALGATWETRRGALALAVAEISEPRC